MATRAWGMPPSLDSIPVTVLTALRRLDESLLPEWVQMQDELAALSSDSAHITAREAVRAAAGLVSGPGRPVGDALVERHGLGPSQRDLPAVREDPGDLGGPGAAGGLGSVLAEPGFSSALSRVKPQPLAAWPCSVSSPAVVPVPVCSPARRRHDVPLCRR